MSITVLKEESSVGRNFNNSIPRPPTSRYYRPPLDLKKEFARRLSKRMMEKGLSQSDLARRMSKVIGAPFGRDLISNYVRAKNIPQPENLKHLADILDCRPEDLLPPGTVGSADSSEAPKFEMRTLKEGESVWLRINAVLPWSAALEVARIIKEHEETDH